MFELNIIEKAKHQLLQAVQISEMLQQADRALLYSLNSFAKMHSLNIFARQVCPLKEAYYTYKNINRWMACTNIMKDQEPWYVHASHDVDGTRQHFV